MAAPRYPSNGCCALAAHSRGPSADAVGIGAWSSSVTRGELLELLHLVASGHPEAVTNA